MKDQLLLIKLLLGFLIISLFNTSTVFAEGISLSAEPASLHIRATPPAEIQAPFTLYNPSTDSLHLILRIQPFEADNGSPSLLSQTATKSAQKILKQVRILDDNSAITTITLGPKQKKNLTVEINLPQNEPLQDHYLSIVIINTEPVIISQKESTGSFIQGGIAIPVLLAVEDQHAPDVSIKEFSTPFYIEAGPVPFLLALENHGEHFSSPKGIILIKNIFGQTIGKVVIPPTTILSQSTREIPEITWEESFLMGLYSADLSLAVSENGPFYHRTIHFLAVPFRQFLGLIIFVLLILFFFFRTKRMLSKM